jgi:Flp pilus assembly pilin Flp
VEGYLKYRLDRGQKGQGVLEYGIMLAIVAIGILLALMLMGNGVKSAYCSVAKGLSAGGTDDVCITTYCKDSLDNMNNWISAPGWGLFNGQVCNTTTGTRHIFNSCSRAPAIGSDYTVTVKVATLYTGSGYGIFFRQQASGPLSGYAFQYDPGYLAGEFIFRKWVNGVELDPPFAHTSAAGYSWYNIPRKISVVVKGSVFKAFVDDILVLTASDTTYPSGGIGLRTWDSTSACFDNIQITVP